MSIAMRLQTHLDRKGVPFGMVTHSYAATASECAEAAHVPGDHLAKSVLLHLEEGPMLAVVPSNHNINLSELQHKLDRRIGLASEGMVEDIFDDCAPGAAPPVGDAYDLPTIVDNSLSGLDRVWFEAGDHRTLIEMEGKDFDKLMNKAQHGDLCVH